MMEPFKKNSFKKNWWKFTNKKKYITYKYLNKLNNDIFLFKAFAKNKALTPPQIMELAATAPFLNFSHSGNSGDIIYALPVLKKISELTARPVNLFLELNVPMRIDKYYVHPLGNVMLNEVMADALIPLISAQNYINSCQILADQKIHIDLSLFRESGIQQDRGSIARWNFYTTGVIGDLNNPWLDVSTIDKYADTVIVARSSRYNNPLINYSFLSEYDNLIFLGVESEYLEMKKMIANIKHIKVNDFLQLAQIIKSCKLFIGNQSFPYSVAEALKVPRLLEVYYDAPNVVTEGPNGYDFYFQQHLEYLVKTLYAS